MKKKIIGILVMMLLITIALPAIGFSNEKIFLIEHQKYNPICTNEETTVTLYPTADATVAEGYPDTNYGDETSLYLQSFTEDFKNERIYLKFDISGIPEDAIINEAILRMYCWSAEYANRESKLYGIKDTFDELTVTWKNQPWDSGSDPLLTSRNMTLDDSDSWCEWSGNDLISHVQVCIPLEDLMLMLKTEPESVSGKYRFNSREYNENIGELVITYVEPSEPWTLEIEIKGGLLGHKITVKNTGNENVSGNLSMTITTDAPIMILGNELSIENRNVDIAAGGIVTISMRPVIGLGSATISITGNFHEDSGETYPFEANTNGMVLLFFVKYGAIPITIPPP